MGIVLLCVWTAPGPPPLPAEKPSPTVLISNPHGAGHSALVREEGPAYSSLKCQMGWEKALAAGVTAQAWAAAVDLPILAYEVRLTNAIDALAFSPHGLLLAAATEGQALKLWHAQTGRDAQMINDAFAGTQRVVSLAFSPDGQIMASAEDLLKSENLVGSDVKLWEVRSGNFQRSIAVNKVRFNIAQALRSRYSRSRDALVEVPMTVVCILRYGADLFWPASVLDHVIEMQDTAAATRIKSVVFLPDGKTALTLSHICAVSGHSHGVIREWDLGTGNLRREWRHDEDVYSVALSPDGQTLAIGCDGKIELRDLNEFQLHRTLQDSRVRGPAGTVAFSPDGCTIASGYGSGLMRVPGNPAAWLEYFESVQSVHLWNVSGAYLKRLSDQQPGTVTSVAFSPDGKHLAIGNGSGTVRLYRIW